MSFLSQWTALKKHFRDATYFPTGSHETVQGKGNNSSQADAAIRHLTCFQHLRNKKNVEKYLQLQLQTCMWKQSAFYYIHCFNLIYRWWLQSCNPRVCLSVSVKWVKDAVNKLTSGISAFIVPNTTNQWIDSELEAVQIIHSAQWTKQTFRSRKEFRYPPPTFCFILLL